MRDEREKTTEAALRRLSEFTVDLWMKLEAHRQLLIELGVSDERYEVTLDAVRKRRRADMETLDEALRRVELLDSADEDVPH